MGELSRDRTLLREAEEINLGRTSSVTAAEPSNDWELAAGELASLLGVLAHGQRVQILAALRAGEQDVTALQRQLGVTHSRVSQHLALLRAHRLVAERRQGRRRIYRLVRPAFAQWLLEGLRFLEAEAETSDRIRDAVQRLTLHGEA